MLFYLSRVGFETYFIIFQLGPGGDGIYHLCPAPIHYIDVCVYIYTYNLSIKHKNNIYSIS